MTHYIAVYSLKDLLPLMGGLAYILYSTLKALMPHESLLLSSLIQHTQQGHQSAQHLRPTFNIMNDSMSEMAAAARDMVNNRSRMKPSGCFCLRRDKLAKWVRQNLRKELDLVRILRKQRESEGLIWAATNRS